MRIAASTCREQEAIQQRVAETATLENRRKIAGDAAKAWRKEAIEAEKREAKESARRLKEAALITQTSQDSALPPTFGGRIDAR